MGKGTELETQDLKLSVITDPVEQARMLLSKNTNIQISAPSFSFDHLEDEIKSNPTILLKLEKKIEAAIADGDLEEIKSLTTRYKQYHRKRCLIIEAGEAMYTYDEGKKAPELTRFFKFLDTTSNEVFVMRQTVALSNFDILNKARFDLAVSDKENVLGLTKESVYDKNVLYSPFIVVDITFMGAVPKKGGGGNYHAIKMQLSDLANL